VFIRKRRRRLCAKLSASATPRPVETKEEMRIYRFHTSKRPKVIESKETGWMEHVDGTTIARGGGDSNVGVMVESHSRSVFKLAYRMTGNEQDAKTWCRKLPARLRQLDKFVDRSTFGTGSIEFRQLLADLIRFSQAPPGAMNAPAKRGAGENGETMRPKIRPRPVAFSGEFGNCWSRFRIC